MHFGFTQTRTVLFLAPVALGWKTPQSAQRHRRAKKKEEKKKKNEKLKKEKKKKFHEKSVPKSTVFPGGERGSDPEVANHKCMDHSDSNRENKTEIEKVIRLIFARRSWSSCYFLWQTTRIRFFHSLNYQWGIGLSCCPYTTLGYVFFICSVMLFGLLNEGEPPRLSVVNILLLIVPICDKHLHFDCFLSIELTFDAFFTLWAR